MIHKSFIWLPPRTGTTLALEVLEKFSFKSYRIVKNIVDFENPLKLHAHTPCLFGGHVNFLFLITMRNPYSRSVSEYLMGINKSEKFDLNKHKAKYEIFLMKRYQKAHMNPIFRKYERLPDYIIRTENIYHDYLQIPFIKDSDFSKSGELKKLVDKKINKNQFDIDWKLFYNKKTADMVYYNNINLFETFDYDKNSWML